MERDVVTLDEVKGEVTYVEECHDVERVAVNLKNPYCYETYQRVVRDKMRLLIVRRRQRRDVKRRRRMSSGTAWFATS